MSKFAAEIHHDMQRLSLSLLSGLLLTVLLGACLQKEPARTTTPLPVANPSDSTLYGLVCDGSNDSILVLLPLTGEDTLDILDASLQQRVFGSLRVGDRVAIMRDTASDSRAQSVIVTQDLLGQWCYKVRPTLRRRPGMEHDMQTSSQLSDSINELLQQELEYGMNIKIDSVVMPIGMRNRTANEDSPVEYPPLKRYRQWYISNGQLLLTVMTIDSLGNAMPAATDTASFVLLNADSLVLRFADGEHSYYRKTE